MTQQDTPSEADESRRNIMIAAGVAIASAVSGVFGWSIGTASGSSHQAGEAGTQSNPYDIAWVTTVNYDGRTSDPSSPDDGTSWYRSDL